jgi:hypothetical protein
MKQCTQRLHPHNVIPASVPESPFLYVPFMKQHNYYVYLLTSTDNSTFYVGVTNDLIRRVLEHKIHKNDGFTSKYNITNVYGKPIL